MCNSDYKIAYFPKLVFQFITFYIQHFHIFIQISYVRPPTFDLSKIPESLPIWMAYGGNDALGDVIDVQHTLKELKSKPDVLFLEDYGHVDFLLSTRAYEDLYDNMINFFRSCGNGMSSSF